MPPPGSVLHIRSVILEAWDSDSKAGYFPGITFKALRLCSTLRPNFTAAQQKLAAAGTSVPPALMVRAARLCRLALCVQLSPASHPNPGLCGLIALHVGSMAYRACARDRRGIHRS